MSRHPPIASLDPRARQLLRTLIGALHPRRRAGRARRRWRGMRGWTSARRRSATSWPTSRRSACSPRRTPRPAACRPRRATACSSTRCCRCSRCRRARSRGCAASCRPASGTQALLGNASELLSAMTHFVGVVSVPQREQFAFRHIDFVPLDGAARAGDPGVRRQRGAEPHHPDAPRLRRRPSSSSVANYLNAHFAGRPLAEIRAHAAARAAQRPRRDGAAAGAVGRAGRAGARAGAGDDMLLAGQTRLMGVQDLADLDRLRELFEAFARKREILQLLERTVQRAGRAHLHRRGNRAGAAGRHARWSPRPMPPAGRCWACWA